MTHWTDAYIGRKHVDGEYDCASLVVDVLRERYGMEVQLPVARVHYEAGKNFNDDINYWKCSLSERVEKPRDGDIVLLQSADRLSHIGIYVVINNVPYVLHNLAGRNTCLHKLRFLSKYVLTVEGFYRLKEVKEDNDASRPLTASADSNGE